MMENVKAMNPKLGMTCRSWMQHQIVRTTTFAARWDDHQGGQVRQTWCGDERVCGVDPQSHQQQVEHGDAATEDLHLPEGCTEERAADAREDSWHDSRTSRMDGVAIAHRSARDERSTKQLLESCEHARDSGTSPPDDASNTGAAEGDSGELGEHGEEFGPELSAEREPDGDALQCDASEDPCTFHDEHDHVLACDRESQCNSVDASDIHVRDHGRQTKEKSDEGTLRERYQKRT